jgi:hypothetical protein
MIILHLNGHITATLWSVIKILLWSIFIAIKLVSKF